MENFVDVTKFLHNAMHWDCAYVKVYSPAQLNIESRCYQAQRTRKWFHELWVSDEVRLQRATFNPDAAAKTATTASF
jgi:hypothetical protein